MMNRPQGPTPVGQRNRAQTINGIRFDGPSASEWDDITTTQPERTSMTDNPIQRADALRWATYGDMTDAEIREYLGIEDDDNDDDDD
jgi:hypothetical protein